MSCTCPHAMQGNVCKHQVALLLQVGRLSRQHVYRWFGVCKGYKGNETKELALANAMAEAEAEAQVSLYTMQAVPPSP